MVPVKVWVKMVVDSRVLVVARMVSTTASIGLKLPVGTHTPQRGYWLIQQYNGTLTNPG